MKVLILAGGFGTRLSEETVIKPKPLLEIGEKPILWHIMKIYSHYGYNDFVILTGYKGYSIKEYFANYFLHNNNVTFNLADNSMEFHQNKCEPWKITILDTGYNTMTGGRIKLAKEVVGNEPFMLTYGDGVADINIKKLVEFHKSHKKLITVTSVQPEGRFGALEISDDNKILHFKEKPKGDNSWLNGGFFVCQPEVIDYINAESTIFEHDPLENLAKEGELIAYKHFGFWKCMDTLRDKSQLNELWESNKANWKLWK